MKCQHDGLVQRANEARRKHTAWSRGNGDPVGLDGAISHACGIRIVEAVLDESSVKVRYVLREYRGVDLDAKASRGS